MRHATYNTQPKTQWKYCVLVPEIKTKDILKEYITPFGLDPEEVVVIELFKTGKKTPAKIMKEYAVELLDTFKDVNPKYVIVGDTEYYKILTKQKASETNLGYVQSVDDIHYVYVPNFKQIFYDPDLVRSKIAHSMNALLAHEQGEYAAPGLDIIKTANYPNTLQNIIEHLQRLFNYNKPITCDIEGFSLKHYASGIGTIAFARNQNEGLAFTVDLNAPLQNYLAHPEEYKFAVREVLRDFFINFPQKIIFHNASFDVTVLIYQLFMNDIEDTEGLLYGLNVFMEKVECTKLIAYLATNTCAGNTLGLKPLSHEFSGNYSVDEITNILAIPPEELLQYNLVDCLSTWYVYNKYYPIMVADNQEQVYRELFLPSLADIIQMQLTGMPINPVKVQEAKVIMERDKDIALKTLNNNYIVQEFVHTLKEKWMNDKNAKLKKKRVTVDEAPADLAFNPNSDPQLRMFLYEHLGLPVLGLTDSKMASTKGDIIEKLYNRSDKDDLKELLKAIMDFKDVIIILNTFIAAFERAIQGPSGQWYIFGNFNLGGTVSGRLSSNGPNLQNIPSNGTKYAKLIKSCFMTNEGWLFVGLDFASLEDRISALTTKDPNKLKVYTDGYDGHSLRAYSYFGENMPDINPDSVDSINSIAKKYEELRQDSKVPTFLLTYGGTWMGIVDKVGFTETKARMIETRYHNMYVVSDEWVQAKLDQASIDGYVTVAFGLRVRTPLLKQVIRGSRVTPFEAEAEGRTAGNALGQSWGLLNNRAVTAFMKKVRANPKYRLLIRPCAQIHDANYYIIKDDPELIVWMNYHLSEAVKWQDHPDIWHDEVKLGGELDIFYPSWAEKFTLPNDLTVEKLHELCANHIENLEKKAHKK